LPNKKYISFLHPTVIQSIPGYKKTHLMELTFSGEGVRDMAMVKHHMSQAEAWEAGVEE